MAWGVAVSVGSGVDVAVGKGVIVCVLVGNGVLLGRFVRVGPAGSDSGSWGQGLGVAVQVGSGLVSLSTVGGTIGATVAINVGDPKV